MAALREIIAAFGVEFDKAGNLARGDKQISGLTKKLAGIGAAIGGAVAGFVAVDKVVDFSARMISAGDAIGDTADQLGVSAKELQQWGFAMKLSGGEASDFEAAIRRLGMGLNDAAQGAGNAATFKKLGVDLKDAAGQLRPVGSVFEEVAGRIGALENPTEQAGVAAQLFGKQYSKLLPLFRRGPEGLAALRQEFDALGGGFSDDFVQGASEFEDNMDKLKLSGLSLVSEVLTPILPVLTELGKQAIAFVRSLTSKSNGSSVITDVAKAVGNIFSGFVKINDKSSVFSNILDGLGAGVQFLLRGFYAVEDAVVFLAGGKSLLGKRLDEAFGAGSQAKVRGFFTGIVAWIGKIDFKAIVKGVARVLDGFETLRNSFIVKFAAGAIKAIGDIGSALMKLPETVTAAFTAMWNTILDGTASVVASIGTAISKIPGAQKLGASVSASAVDVRGKKIVGPATPAKPGASVGAAAAQAQADSILALVQAQVATAQVPTGAGTTTNTINAPVSTTVNVTVEGGADVANRVGKAAAKGASQGSLTGVKAALVPTPG